LSIKIKSKEGLNLWPKAKLHNQIIKAAFMRKYFTQIILICLILFNSNNSCAESLSKSFEKDLGIEYVTVVGDKLKVKISLEPRCFFGDMEGMILESRTSAKDAKFFLSLEDMMDDGAISPVSVELPRADAFNDQMEYDLPIPANYKGILGLFICKESTGQFKKCKDKQIVDYGEILKRYQVNYNKTDKTVQNVAASPDYSKDSSDKIFFVKPIFVEGHRLLVPTKAMSKERYGKFDEFFTLMKIDQNMVKRAIENIQFMGSTIGSLPLRIENARIALVLPVFGSKKCGL
jgi:hypothetical protein